MTKYKCPTLGDCDKANAGEIFERSPGEDLKCPCCATQLEPQLTVLPPGGGKKWLPLVGGAVLLALLTGGGYWYAKRQQATAVAVGGAAAATKSATIGIAPSEAETTALRRQGEAQLLGGDAEQAAAASGRAAVNELLKLAIANMAQGKLDAADKDLMQARERGPKESLVYYNTAVLRVKQGRNDDALKELEASFMAGFSHFDKLEQDRDLGELRKNARFIALIKQYDTVAR